MGFWGFGEQYGNCLFVQLRIAELDCDWDSVCIPSYDRISNRRQFTNGNVEWLEIDGSVSNSC
jgi:hypothetical protein